MRLKSFRPSIPVRELLVLAFTIFAPVCAGAQEMQPAQACSAVAPPPPALAGWSSPAMLVSASAAGDLSKAMLTTGQGATVTLHPTREVGYLVQPEKPGGSVAHGGLLDVSIADGGTYQISLNSGAWVDLLKDGAAMRSSAHSPGPACTGIRKTVQFPLQPGTYVLQLSANADPTIQVMVSKVP